jgi:hypothetical protein
MRVMSTVVLCAVGLLVLELSAAQADPVAPFRRVVANHCITPPCLPTVTDGSPLNLSETITAADGSKLVSNISAVSTFGELRALASAELDRVTLGTGFTFVSAQMTDVLTVDFASLIGNMGFLVVNYKLEGSITESGIVNNEAQVAVLVDRDGFGTGVFPENWNSVHDSSVSGLFATRPFTFIYGQPFNFAVDLNLALGTVAFGGTPISLTDPVVGFGAGAADFSNTLSIASFSLFNTSMAPVGGATVTAGSGVSYAVTPVPEPGTLFLLGIGALLLQLTHRSRR